MEQVSLLAACVRRGVRVLSATGAGARADPTRIRVADLRESTNDPLSRAVMLLFFFFIQLLCLIIGGIWRPKVCSHLIQCSCPYKQL